MVVLDSVVVRGAVLDGSSKVRGAFIHWDPQMTGFIAPWKVAECFRAASLQFEDTTQVIKQFTREDNRFNWIVFCEALEKRTRKYSTLTQSPSAVSFNSNPSSLPPLLRVASSLGSFPMLPGTPSKGMTTSTSQQSLLLRPPHPQGYGGPPCPPRSFSTQSLRSSPSLKSLEAKQSERAMRVRKIFTAADLRATQFNSMTQVKLQKAARAASSRALLPTYSAAAAPEETYEEPLAAPQYTAPPPGPPKPDKQKLKQSQFVKSASDALNSRFSDMFKAFQYVDLDRSGTLNKKELVRALDLWNIPIDNDKLDELIAACDENGDGDVDYKEFVDVLARDTVTIAAMGKRDMQSKEAMGVADLDPEFLGHKHAKNVRATLNDHLYQD